MLISQRKSGRASLSAHSLVIVDLDDGKLRPLAPLVALHLPFKLGVGNGEFGCDQAGRERVSLGTEMSGGC